MQKAKWLSEEALQIAEQRREVKGKGGKERCLHLITQYQRIARRYKKASLNDQCKEIEENNRMGKTRNLFKKIREEGILCLSCKSRHLETTGGGDQSRSLSSHLPQNCPSTGPAPPGQVGMCLSPT